MAGIDAATRQAATDDEQTAGVGDRIEDVNNVADGCGHVYSRFGA